MTSTWILRPQRAAAIAIVACVLPAVAVGAIPSDPPNVERDQLGSKALAPGDWHLLRSVFCRFSDVCQRDSHAMAVDRLTRMSVVLAGDSARLKLL